MPKRDLSVEQLRKICGMPPIEKAMVNCMMCGKPFMSEDKKKNRRCPNCSYDANRASYSDGDVNWPKIDAGISTAKCPFPEERSGKMCSPIRKKKGKKKTQDLYLK